MKKITIYKKKYTIWVSLSKTKTARNFARFVSSTRCPKFRKEFVIFVPKLWKDFTMLYFPRLSPGISPLSFWRCFFCLSNRVLTSSPAFMQINEGAFVLLISSHLTSSDLISTDRNSSELSSSSECAVNRPSSPWLRPIRTE